MCTEGVAGVILRGRSGKKSQVSNKCSRVRFSEMARSSLPSPFQQDIKMQFMSIVTPTALPSRGEINIFVGGAEGCR